MLRTDLYADPTNIFVHDAILASCRKHAPKTALVDASCGRRMTYAEYGETVEAMARGLVAAGVKPGEVVAIFLPNSWEFCVAYHAATLAGAIPTLLNPTYREREVRYQLENSGAVLLITDAANIAGIHLAWATQSAASILHAGTGKRKRAVLQLAEAGEHQVAASGSWIAGDIGGAALFQRHDGTAQGCDALALQPGGKRISVNRARSGVAEVD